MLTWHEDKRTKDGHMRHPADSPAWKLVDYKWPEFASESRNLRLALSAGGINRHSSLSSRYSCWPVILVTYNLPPWLCMKRKFMMLSLLISGPKQPGNDIDIYLEPLIDDLQRLWDGVNDVYDAHRKEYFTLRAVLLWTINDFPAYGNLSGCTTKGYKACPICGDKTSATHLPHSRKMSYSCHRKYLPRHHPYRRQKKAFNNEQEFEVAPPPLSGEEVLKMVEDINCEYGKGKKKKTSDSNGRTRHTLQSYIGMLVRKMVPINVVSWPEVDGDLKENLWIDVQDTFKVAPESRKLVLTSAGTKWRQFKTTLTNKYVLPFLGKKKKLRKPPKQYSFVGLQPWKEFVKERCTENWLKLHNEQSARVRKRKYPHRLSRKGYIGLEEELKRTLPEGEIIDRAIMWKKARVPKNGKIDEELSLVATKIDELLEKKSKGELEISGSSDVLSQALETPEHSGRVRGVGGFFNPSTYFNLPKKKRIRITKADILARDKERDMELEETKRMLLAQQRKTEDILNQRIAQLEALITGKTAMPPPATGENVISPISDKGSWHDKPRIGKFDPIDGKVIENVVEEDCNIIPAPGKGAGSCELAVDNINNIVAFGTVFEEGDISKTLHGVPLKEGTVRVSVDGILKSDAVLPFPIKGEMEFVRDAIGSHVAWPKDLVIQTMIKKKTKTPHYVKSLFEQVELNPWVPKRCKLLYKHATTIMKETGSSISTILSENVFGVPKQLYILCENVIQVLEMQWIGQGVIAAYMACLHELLTERDALDTFAFVDPAATYNCERPDFVRYLVDRLKEGKSDRIFFMPYNPGKHWILTIIWEGEIYILDPLPKPVHYQVWETSVINAMKTFNAETGRVNKLPKVKSLPGVPKQPGGVEYGYYVMRYMKDIIEDETLSFPTKWAVKTRKSYSQNQIDEVRIEVADYMQSLM